jgi:CheY-like chemotaxis protein
MKTKCKFLIVDDNEVDQMVTRTLLKKKLAVEDVSQARTGSEALEWLKVSGDSIGDCLVILLDIQMPEMDGFEFLEAYDQVDESVKHKTTIIMLSSTLDPTDIRRATDHKYVKSLFSKPVPTGLLDELMMSAGA